LQAAEDLLQLALQDTRASLKTSVAHAAVAKGKRRA
jgi:hypothetical protein